MTTDSNVWTLITEMHDGHRLFKTVPSKTVQDGARLLIAIADQSGGWPHETEDGILWLDYERNLMLPSGRDHFPKIPCVDPEGKKSYTPTDVATVMSLSHRFGWPINVDGLLFAAMRVV